MRIVAQNAPDHGPVADELDRPGGFLLAPDEFTDADTEWLAAWLWAPGLEPRSVWNGTAAIDHGGWFEIPERDRARLERALEQDLERFGEPAFTPTGEPQPPRHPQR